MSILIIPVILCAAYLVMVSLCVCERMTANTNHVVRVTVVGIGGVGFWALCKGVVFGWGSTPEELMQGAAIVALAVAIGLSPRFKTECADERTSNRKYGQGR
jgi:uncharacterized membrane protein YhiD involved in acid resistance